jgi:hypothetical protein
MLSREAFRFPIVIRSPAILCRAQYQVASIFQEDSSCIDAHFSRPVYKFDEPGIRPEGVQQGMVQEAMVAQITTIERVR